MPQRHGRLKVGVNPNPNPNPHPQGGREPSADRARLLRAARQAQRQAHAAAARVGNVTLTQFEL
eukprot:scaffold38370_cov27-Phaeocystis_antarctica.AAC.2